MISNGGTETKNERGITDCNGTSISNDIKTSSDCFSKLSAMEKTTNKNSCESLSDVDADLGNVDANQSMHASTISEESDLSLALERDLDCVSMRDWDELPVFKIRELSPIGRTPSPIDPCDYTYLDELQTPTRDQYQIQTPHPCEDNPNFVALHELDAQISPPSDGGSINADDNDGSCSLETIFEGIFLNTPPRQKVNSDSKLNVRHNTPNRNQTMRSRVNLLEKVAMNRLQAGKENQMPMQQFEDDKRNITTASPPPPQQARKSLTDIGELTF